MRRRSHWLKIEVLPRIVIAYVLDHVADPFHFVRQFAVCYFLAKQLAQNPPEVLVPRERQKTTRIRQHADKTTQKPHIRQRVDLPGHSVLLIHEPPRRTELHLPCNRSVIEISGHE